MKNLLISAAIIIISSLLLPLSGAVAQNRSSYFSDKGYWVLVSNRNIKKETTVLFYNNADELIYQEQVQGRKLDLKKLKTIRCLKKGLDSALLAWNEANSTSYNKSWVASNL